MNIVEQANRIVRQHAIHEVGKKVRVIGIAGNYFVKCGSCQYFSTFTQDLGEARMLMLDHRLAHVVNLR